MISERQKSLNKIRKAFEQGKLGFQKGAKSCLYYDSATDSKCAVGVLINARSKLKNSEGDIDCPFKQSRFGGQSIGAALDEAGLDSFKGLTRDELQELQEAHDGIIHYGESSGRLDRFKFYLYSLEA